MMAPIENLIQREVARSATAAKKAALPREFRAWGEDRYSFAVADLGLTIEVDRLRREHGELIGELSARCELPGARVVNGSSLSIADLNFSSARARTDRAKLLATRANIPDLDWTGLVEDFCQRVLDADRIGQPAVDLRGLPRPSRDDDTFDVLGLALPRQHPTVLFGDGGTGKSYIALNIAGRLAEAGVNVALFDWELGGEDHRDRLERLFPDGMPRVLYARCERPLVYETDRLRRIVRDNAVEYAVYDSVAFAADGPPEAAEVAGRYFRAVRQIGCGSLHVAHVSKAADADKKPFGSTFWHNGARSTWFVRQSEESAGSDSLNVGLFHRKANMGRLRPAVGLTITFGDERTSITRADVADSPDLAGQLSVRQRMAHILKRGAFGYDHIAEEIDADPETVRRTARRYRKQFVIIDGGKVGLATGADSPPGQSGQSGCRGGGHTPSL
jgi:hypothetical protein